MKTWLLYVVWTIEAFIVLAVIYFEPSYCVRGILWQEAFFDGKPTSWWRDELNQWEITRQPGIGRLSYAMPVFRRNPTRAELFRERWFPGEQPESLKERAIQQLARDLERGEEMLHGPRILHRQEDAKPVLTALLDDPSPQIRLFAQIGLGMNPKIPGDE